MCIYIYIYVYNYIHIRFEKVSSLSSHDSHRHHLVGATERQTVLAEVGLQPCGVAIQNMAMAMGLSKALPLVNPNL